MSTGRALGTLVAVLILLAAYIGIASAVGVREFWVGFLFLFQWSVMEEAKVEALPKSIIGACVGVGIASLTPWLTPVVGAQAAAGAQLAVCLVAIFLFIKQTGIMVVNTATMLFLTVMTVPLIATGTRPEGLYIGLVLGVFYFGGLALVAGWVGARLAKAHGGAVTG